MFARYPVPTISSVFLKPSFTPLTMFARFARMVPWIAPWERSVPGSSITSVALLPSCVSPIPGASVMASWPFGPLTVTSLPFASSVTPDGTSMIFLPTRDMAASLPDLREDLAAEAGRTGLLVGHETLRGREDRRAETAQDAGDVGLPHVDAPSRRADALEPREDRAVVRRVLEIDAKDPLLGILDALEVRDVLLTQQELREFFLEARGRDVDLLVP